MTITFMVSAATAARMKDAASRKRISTSKYVRDMIESRLNREKPKKSLYDRMMEIGAIGCFSGPRDLSTNPRHMKGFGRDNGNSRHRTARRTA